jgi:Predicted ATPase of the PP-loop superfamily implicated in cell cycle control
MEAKEIERSLIKKYRKTIWKPFVKAVIEYELIKENDKIAICISGGKDSFVLAKCMQELKKHGKIGFDLEFIVMDPGYKKENRLLIIENAKKLDIPIDIFDSNIFEVTSKANGNPCYLCARMRRGFLYDRARELGCNKIALGHHFNDVIETTLLSMFYSGEIKTMMPKLHSTNFKGLELIRPLYLVEEDAINAFKRYNNLNFLNCACKFTEESEKKEDLSKRREMKRLIKSYEAINKHVKNNIFKSTSNINLNAVIGYHKDGIKQNFLDKYDEK